MYTAKDTKIIADRKRFMAQYPPFQKRIMSKEEREHLADLYQVIITCQNGPDFDDYCVIEGGKLVQYMKGRPPGKMLILGVGTGREVLVAQEMGFDAVGVTLGSRNVEFGHRLLGLNNENHRELLLEALPFPRETFDYVIGMQTFEHAIAPMLFLLEQGRVLKDGGLLALEWPAAESHQGGDNPHHQICYTPGQAKSLLGKAGFKVTKLCFEDMTPIPEDQMWRGDQKKMLYIEGIKGKASHEWLKTAWKRIGG